MRGRAAWKTWGTKDHGLRDSVYVKRRLERSHPGTQSADRGLAGAGEETRSRTWWDCLTGLGSPCGRRGEGSHDAERLEGYQRVPGMRTGGCHVAKFGDTSLTADLKNGGDGETHGEKTGHGVREPGGHQRPSGMKTASPNWGPPARPASGRSAGYLYPSVLRTTESLVPQRAPSPPSPVLGTPRRPDPWAHGINARPRPRSDPSAPTTLSAG